VTRARRNLVGLSIAALLALGGLALMRWYAIEVIGESDLHVLHVLLMQRFHLAPVQEEPPNSAALATDVHNERPILLDSTFAPFREIGARLGARAAGNQIFRTRGAVIADFNGDGKMDLFLPQSGQTVGFTTEKNVLTEKPLPQKPCVLYLNQGNDADGNPILVSIQDLEARGNDKNVRAELLIENKYRPRESVKDDEFAIGRMSTGAVAADFNGDGRLDLWITDDLAGLPFTTEETALRGYPAQRNIGRDERKHAITIRLPQFLRRPLVDGRNVRLQYGGKEEYEGRDSLFLNMGDSDGDGIPEWKDVTEEAGVGGRWASFSVAVADIDLDGDLDVFVANYQDPDFYGFGMRRYGGNQNELYLNQLVETGKLTFKNVAKEWHVSGLIDEEGLKASLYFPSSGKEEPIAEQTVEGKPAGEKADHSWSALFVDQNLDGYPDLVVSTDEGDRLRVYTNDHGKGFIRDRRFDDDRWDGCWMGTAAGDLDGDGREELFVSNCGGQSMSAANMALLNKEQSDESILALAPLNYAMERARLANVILTPRPDGYGDISDIVTVHHSPYIAPDLVRRENFAPSAIRLYDAHNYAHGLSAYEFAFAAAMLDVEDDGDLDLYWAGALARGNDGFIGDWTNSPGRLLVNDTPAEARGRPERIELTDRTLEYRLLDITDMDYEHNPPRRRSPGTNWHKRDYINIEDMDSYSEAGVAASQHSLIHDLFFMHEAANGIATGDLNGDGFDDIVVTHYGGYNSLSPKAGNLKANVGGMVLAIPAPNKVMKPPTGFEEGPTFVYMNENAKRAQNHWAKIRLRDERSLNRFAIGARLTASGPSVKATRMVRAGGCAGSASSTDVIVGLGRDGALSAVDVEWPRRDRTPQHYELPKVRDQLICIERQRGVVTCP
jgi:hypothetical protein